MNKIICRLIVACIGFAASPLIAKTSATNSTYSAVWQWSVSVPSIENRRAYLWIPENCKRVRGLVVACHNMIEQPLFERPAFREACAANDLGIVMVFSGHDKGMDDDKNPSHPKRSYLDIFLNPAFSWGKSSEADENPKLAGEDLQKALDEFADESGYSEIRYAPLLPVGHSSAGSFVWHIYKWNPGRIFAMMPFKTAPKSDGPQGIPILDVNSEFFDLGKEANNCSTTPGTMNGLLGARGNGDDSLFGYYIDVGSGHCAASDDAIPMMSLFFKKAVAARIPKNAPRDKPVTLLPVKTKSGWLIDAAKLGKPDGKPVAYEKYAGDPKKAFWYLDEEFATAVQNHMAAQYAKAPQRFGFIKDGAVLTNAGMQGLSPKFIDDRGTFKVEAVFVEQITNSDIYPTDTKFSHGDKPIQYRANAGSSLMQVGPDTFRVCPRFGPLAPQGPPWCPTLIAFVPGDEKFQPAEHPATIFVSPINTAGEAQTLDWPKIPDQKAGAKTLKLAAKASSRLPVQFFMVSGPATIEDDTLKFEKLPPRAKFPVRILVAAYQFGRTTDPKIQSIKPVMQEFFIKR